MSMAHDYVLIGVHVLINLLRRGSFVLYGIVYHLFPAISKNIYAKLHFWSANIGNPLMMIGLWANCVNTSSRSSYDICCVSGNFNSV